MVKPRVKSEDLFQELIGHIPGGVNSPARAFSGIGITPLIVEKGSGDEITDIDGRVYIDYNMAWGSLILGHVHPKIQELAKQQIDLGSSFGITTVIEHQFAKKLKELVPSIEKSRVVASGTEATMTAVRIARGYTGRHTIIKFNGNYHGHSDAFLVQAGSGVGHHFKNASSKGIPQEVIQHSVSLPFNDEQAFSKYMDIEGKHVAAVIIEPVAANMGVVPATRSFINLLRKKTREVGAVLIFDEVITGFRIGSGGAQAYYQVVPDLSTFGKIVGGGFPVGVVGGKSELMDMLAPNGPVYQAGTLSGNPVALHAGYGVLHQLEQAGFYETLQSKADLLLEPIEKIVRGSALPICLNRMGSMFSFFFGIDTASNFEEVLQCSREKFNRFFIELFEAGIYLSPSPFEASFVSMAHTDEHLLYTRDKIIDILQVLEEEMKAGSLSQEYVTSKS